MMTLVLVVGMIVLPVLLWSWWRTGNDDDASLALGIMAWMVLASIPLGALVLAIT